ncbi:TolC family protein [Gloeocapsa sp. PCC 73106]|uniref:TolC family protein n=1 Tax=Gloeocapsa sp. PCC 73106 TaxID=102232 RepID=UPI0002AC21C3|nr:TolC family protein [Gloeocapsa sp. PCC 73106]ELR97021.1 outer membrane protein [Gloeocapsa sp. PCC 73106]
MLNFGKLFKFSVVGFLLYAGCPLAQELPESTPIDPGVESQVNENPPPSGIEPSANPLLFPTNPEEVNVQEVIPITLQQALDVGLRNNKDVEIARLELERSQSQLREAQAALYPTLDFNSEVEYSKDPSIKISNERFLTEREIDTTAGIGTIELSFDIYDGGNRGATIRRQRQSLRSSQLNVETVVEETRFNITQNYYELQNADAQVAIAQAAVEDGSQSLRDAQLREQAGLGTRFDVLQAEVDLANASQGLTTAISEQRTARRALVETLNLGQTVELSAADEIQEAGEWGLNLDQSIVLAYQNRAELERLLLEREIGAENRQIALAEVRPNLSVFANYNFLDDDLGDEIGVKDGYAVGGRLRWRLFDGGRASARAKQADRDIEIAESRFTQQRNQIRLEVETAFFDLLSNDENIGTAQTAVVTADERLRLARLRFQAGVGTQTEVIDAQRDLTEARGNFLQAVIGYNQSLNSLQRAVSNLPDNQLFRVR